MAITTEIRLTVRRSAAAVSAGLPGHLAAANFGVELAGHIVAGAYSATMRLTDRMQPDAVPAYAGLVATQTVDNERYRMTDYSTVNAAHNAALLWAEEIGIAAMNVDERTWLGRVAEQAAVQAATIRRRAARVLFVTVFARTAWAIRHQYWG